MITYGPNGFISNWSFSLATLINFDWQNTVNLSIPKRVICSVKETSKCAKRELVRSLFCSWIPLSVQFELSGLDLCFLDFTVFFFCFCFKYWTALILSDGFFGNVSTFFSILSRNLLRIWNIFNAEEQLKPKNRAHAKSIFVIFSEGVIEEFTANSFDRAGWFAIT